MSEPVRKVRLAINYTAQDDTLYEKELVLEEHDNTHFENAGVIALSSTFVDKNPDIFRPCSQDGESREEMRCACTLNDDKYQLYENGAWVQVYLGAVLNTKRPLHLYRRKPEPKYRPYTAEDLDKMGNSLVFKKGEQRFFVTSYNAEFVYFLDSNQENKARYKSLLEQFKNLDGSPCGVKIEP